MAGKPGRSGGARPGAGRPRKEPDIIQLAATYSDPRQFLIAVMNDLQTDIKLRVDAAKALMPYEHQRKADTAGKKEEAKDKAHKAGVGMFAPMPPPGAGLQ